MLPKHLAFAIEGTIELAHERKLNIRELFRKDFENVYEICLQCIDMKLPVATFLLMPAKLRESPYFSVIMDEMEIFFASLSSQDIIQKKQVKVSVLGRWYDLPGRVVDEIKRLIEATKDYDGFFLNLCVNYDGQEEIVSACQLIARLVKSDKLDIGAISKESLKENIYASYFIPPDLIIKTGSKRLCGSLLLWDSVDSTVFFTDAPWSSFDRKSLSKALEYYQK